MLFSHNILRSWVLLMARTTARTRKAWPFMVPHQQRTPLPRLHFLDLLDSLGDLLVCARIGFQVLRTMLTRLLRHACPAVPYSSCRTGRPATWLPRSPSWNGRSSRQALYT